MKYLISIGIGAIGFILILFIIFDYLHRTALNDGNDTFTYNWVVFSLLTALVPVFSKFIIKDESFKIIMILTLFSWVIALFLIQIYMKNINHLRASYTVGMINFSWINIAYFIAQIISVGFLKYILVLFKSKK